MRPTVNTIDSKRKMISGFGGYNHNKLISDNEFYDMQNMSSDDYPVLSPRGKRGIVRTLTKPNGLFAHNKLCWVDGTAFYYNGSLVEGFTLADSVKQIVGMGAYILIWPDKKYYNTSDGTFGDLGASFTSSGTVTLTLSKLDGSAYDVYLIQADTPAVPVSGTYWIDTANTLIYQYTTDAGAWVQQGGALVISADQPTTHSDGDFWLDTSTTPHVLKKYVSSAYSAVTDDFTEGSNEPFCGQDGFLWIDTSGTIHELKQYSKLNSMWNAVSVSYVRIAATGIGTSFAEYDGVTLSGFTNTDYNGEFILWGAGDDYILVSGILDAVETQTDAVTIERKIPDLDFICTRENRVWGCSNAEHKIFASALGKAGVWFSYASTSSDSWYATVGSTGNFTGCCAHGNYVLFFKDNIIHRVFGSIPSSFGYSDVNSRGVQAGSEKSLCIVNETLFYKSRNDVCAYTQGLPAAISDALGRERYKNAVGGSYDGKYYISLQDSSDVWHLFVFDVDRVKWYREDNMHVLWFAAIDGELYFIASDNKLYSVGGNITDYAGDGAAIEGDFDWYLETGDIGLDTPDAKYISKIQFNASIGETATAALSVKYDSDSTWTEHGRILPDGRRLHSFPMPQNRCEVMRLRISGKGEFSLYTIARTIEQGSDA